MYLKKMAANLFVESLQLQQDSSAIEPILSEALFGGKDSFDLHSLLRKFSNAESNIAAKAASWLSDDENQSISQIEIERVLGETTIQALSSKLGVRASEAKTGLSRTLPNLIDTASRGGRLFYSVEGTTKKGSSNGLLNALTRLIG